MLLSVALLWPALLVAQVRPPVAVDSSSCLGCGGHRHFGRAAGELMTFELLPYTYNRWVIHDSTAQTTLATWSANLRHGWEWDTDHFPVNQLAHPFSGNLYFNSARSNGYNFWSSAPFSLGGSLLWEYFGETSRPSINDLINTTVGGITLGETLYRLSNLILDRRTTGATRVFRELSAAIVNPPLALSRLLSGDVGRVEANPFDRLPSILTSDIRVGYQNVSSGAAESPLAAPHQAFAFYSLHYGDPLRGDVTHPFGAFRAEATLATGTAGTISELRITGFLTKHDYTEPENYNRQLQFALNYDYLNNRAVLTGGQDVSATLVSRRPVGRTSAVRTELSALGYIIDGVKSDYGPSQAAINNSTARNYDYGMGGGGRFAAWFERGGHDLLEASYQATWIGVLSGTGRDHWYDLWSARAEVPVIGHFALGGSALLYRRTSWYAAHPSVHARDFRTQVFAALAY